MLEWNAERRKWNREHELAWAGVTDPTESGLSPFQVKCEAAIVNALREVGVLLVDRAVIGTQERYVKARLGDSDWTLWIYLNAAEVTSDKSTLVRMEDWDAKTPEEFIATFVRKTVSGIRDSCDRSV